MNFYFHFIIHIINVATTFITRPRVYIIHTFKTLHFGCILSVFIRTEWWQNSICVLWFWSFEDINNKQTINISQKRYSEQIKSKWIWYYIFLMLALLNIYVNAFTYKILCTLYSFFAGEQYHCTIIFYCIICIISQHEQIHR